MPKPKPKPKRLVWRIKQKPPPEPPRWVELPGEITADILGRVGAVEILGNVERVCKTWWKVCHDPTMWRIIDMRNDGDFDMTYDLDKMCRVAVDRSQGQLRKINIEHFGSDDLLNYIAYRGGARNKRRGSKNIRMIPDSIGLIIASELRHLRLVSCYDISPGGLAAVAKKFPLLEELHIYFSLISKVDIEAVGRSCSLLKSFTLNDSGFRGFGSSEFIFSDQALAIAGNMPELRHLALFGSVLTNEGLCTILDGCPRLESLDLRHCYNIDLEGDLGRRCREQIIDLKCPLDSTAGYEFCAQICDYCTSDDEYPFGLSEVDLGLSDYYYDYDYDDFDYDDFTNPFSSEYFDEDGFF